MTKRKIIFLMLATIVLISCGNNAKEEKTDIEIQENYTVTKKESKMNTIKLTKTEFLSKVMNYEQNPQEWVYLGDKPCVIDFYADWCGPCKMVAPILEELAKEYDGEIYIYKIDTEKEQELAQVFGIRSIPSLLFVPMNEQPQMVMGALPKSELKKAIDDVLLKKQGK
ncbi:MAG: thioredoxin [Bacteroidales bacterium]|jgi:thioredoxin|nr:thioredoxin [Bacteroidales bacterium]MDX9798188.1 thioredoxin [Bacteroidales bacterium]